MDSETMVMVVAFVLVTSLAMLGGLFFTGRRQKLEARIDSLSGKDRGEEKAETVAQMARSALPKMGKIIVPEDEAERTKLRARLVHAGLYHRQAMHIFLGREAVLLGAGDGRRDRPDDDQGPADGQGPADLAWSCSSPG